MLAPFHPIPRVHFPSTRTPVAICHPVFFRHPRSACPLLPSHYSYVRSTRFDLFFSPIAGVPLTYCIQPDVIFYLLLCQIDIHVIKNLPDTLGLSLLAITPFGPIMPIHSLRSHRHSCGCASDPANQCFGTSMARAVPRMFHAVFLFLYGYTDCTQSVQQPRGKSFPSHSRLLHRPVQPRTQICASLSHDPVPLTNSYTTCCLSALCVMRMAFYVPPSPRLHSVLLPS